MHKFWGVGGLVLFTSMKQLRTRTWYIFHQTKWFKNPLISVYVIHSSKKIRTLQTKSLLDGTYLFTLYQHMHLLGINTCGSTKPAFPKWCAHCLQRIAQSRDYHH